LAVLRIDYAKTALLDLHTNPFITDRIWYPTPVSLYYHTLNPFNGLLSIPFQGIMSLAAILSGIVLFSFVVAGWGAYLLVYYVLQRTLPATRPTWLRAGALGARRDELRTLGLEHARCFSWRRVGEIFREGYARFA